VVAKTNQITNFLLTDKS